MITIILDKK